MIPVIEKIRQHFDIPISIDTYKSTVAKAAIAAGADLVNDIWGLKYDASLAGVIADAGVACCLMHNRSQIQEHPYENFMEDLWMDLRESKEIEYYWIQVLDLRKVMKIIWKRFDVWNNADNLAFQFF